MKDFFKNKVVTVLIVVATIILAGVAIFTAVRLYQLRTAPVAPTAPASVPEASEEPQPQACQQLAFTISTPTPTPPGTGTPTPTDTATPTPTTTATLTPTPPGTGTPTPTSLSSPTPTDPPVGGPSSTPTPTTTGAPTSTPTPTTGDIAQASPSPTTDPATLPDAGVELPTIFAGAIGVLLIVLSLMLAL